MKSLSSERATLATWWMTLNLAHAALTFPFVPSTSVLADVHFVSPTASQFIGRQLGDEYPLPLVARIAAVLKRSDLCDSTVLKGLNVTNAVIIIEISKGACSFETIAVTASKVGAAAVIFISVDKIPGVMVNGHDGSFGVQTRHFLISVIQIGVTLEQQKAVLIATGEIVQLSSIDASPWLPNFQSWYYLIVFRGCGAIMATSGLIAMLYIYRYVELMNRRFITKVALVRQTRWRCVKLIASNGSFSHGVLMIEAITAPSVGTVLMVGGNLSSPAISFPVWMFLASSLCGWASASSILSAIAWTQKRNQVVLTFRSKSICQRALCGDLPIITVLMCAVPIGIDTAFSIAFSMYYDAIVLRVLFPAVMTLLQLFIGIHLLIDVSKYYRYVSKIATNDIENTDPALLEFLRHLSRCTFGLGLSMLVYVFGGILMASLPVYFGTPYGWTVLFSLSIVGRTMETIFKVLMFRPCPRVRPTVAAVAPACIDPCIVEKHKMHI